MHHQCRWFGLDFSGTRACEASSGPISPFLNTGTGLLVSRMEKHGNRVETRYSSAYTCSWLLEWPYLPTDAPFSLWPGVQKPCRTRRGKLTSSKRWCNIRMWFWVRYGNFRICFTYKRNRIRCLDFFAFLLLFSLFDADILCKQCFVLFVVVYFIDLLLVSWTIKLFLRDLRWRFCLSLPGLWFLTILGSLSKKDNQRRERKSH